MQKLKRPDLSQRVGNILGSLKSYVGNLLPLAKPWPRSLTMIACLVLFLLVLSMCSGCQPRVIRPDLPPQADPRPLPPFNGKTYRDALHYIPEIRESFLSCEQDKRTIREVMGSGDD